jgi:hypothetical protein
MGISGEDSTEVSSVEKRPVFNLFFLYSDLRSGVYASHCEKRKVARRSLLVRIVPPIIVNN